MPTYKLVLHPAVADYVPESDTLLPGVLKQHGITGDSFSHQGISGHLVGEDFLKHIIFLGCSPSVALSPGDGDNFCFIHINGPHQAIQFIQGDVALQPRCPVCREPVSLWQQHLHADNYQCEKCAATTQVMALDWRREAGFGKLFIDIYGIFPQEAVPSEQLLSALEEATSAQWTYFYSNRE